MGTNNQHDIEIIEQYIDGKLTDNEKEQFLQRLENDNALAELYQFRLKIRDDLQKAKQYEQVRANVSSTIKQTKSKARKKYIIYAVAASLTLLIAIPGVLTITNKQEQNTLAKADSTNTEIYEPQIKQPESFADQGKFETNTLTLTLSEKNDSLIFQWKPSPEKQSNFIITRQEDGREIFKKETVINTHKISISNNKLPSGKFIWYIEGFAARDSFEINNN